MRRLGGSIRQTDIWPASSPQIYESFASLRMGGAVIDPDYLSMRSEFWGALMLGLCACLALEGVYKIRRASLET